MASKAVYSEAPRGMFPSAFLRTSTGSLIGLVGYGFVSEDQWPESPRYRGGIIQVSTPDVEIEHVQEKPVTQQEFCKEILPIVQGGAEGKQIQKYLGDSWMDKGPYVGFEPGFKYRIKPEPKYRPFTAEEALKRCVGRVVSRKDCQRKEKLNAVGAVYGGQPCVWLGNSETSNIPDTHSALDYLLEEYVFADDGSPCGVLIED